MDMTRGVPVQIHLETWVNQDGNNEHHEFNEPGQLVQMGDTLYVRYREQTDGDATVPVTFKIAGTDSVMLTRGTAETDTRLQLQFEAEKAVVARYTTPYGVIPVQTVTPRMDVVFTDDPLNGEVYIEYRLDANQQHLGDYRLHLNFTAEE